MTDPTSRTATETFTTRQQQEQRRRVFELMAENFIARWAPDDKYDASRFSAELFSILRQLVIDVTEPWAKQVADTVALYPLVMPEIRSPLKVK